MNRATSPTGWARNPDGSPGYTWNPITGCLNHQDGLCKGGGFPCYAYKLANGRLKPLYFHNLEIALPHENPKVAFDDPFYPREWFSRRERGLEGGKPKGVFVCDMGDLFGIGIPEAWTDCVLKTIEVCPEHRFYLLTKQPQNLIKFSPFPDNAWVGVTATTKGRAWEADKMLAYVKASVKYLSLEPLLDWSAADFGGSFLENDNHINWLKIGACTGTHKEMRELCYRTDIPFCNLKPYGNKFTLQPRIEWVREIVEAADKAGVKVFLKDNLYQLYLSNPQDSCYWMFKDAKLRQEMPEIR